MKLVFEREKRGKKKRKRETLLEPQVRLVFERERKKEKKRERDS